MCPGCLPPTPWDTACPPSCCSCVTKVAQASLKGSHDHQRLAVGLPSEAGLKQPGPHIQGFQTMPPLPLAHSTSQQGENGLGQEHPHNLLRALWRADGTDLTYSVRSGLGCFNPPLVNCLTWGWDRHRSGTAWSHQRSHKSGPAFEAAASSLGEPRSLSF